MRVNQIHVNRIRVNQINVNQVHVNLRHVIQTHANQIHVNQIRVNQRHVNQRRVNQRHVNQRHVNRRNRIAPKIAPTLFDVHACRLYRKKWGEWQKCYEQLESLQLEFEMAVEGKPCLKEFAAEASEKVSGMAAFKKTYMKFSLGLDQYLKKDTLHAPAPHHTHDCIHVYACVYTYIHIFVRIMCSMHISTVTQCAGAHAWTNVPMHVLVQRV
jgi:hypothetical protein